MPVAEKRPPMTADEARSFDRFSVANAARVAGAIAARGCDCEPYGDVFTFGRWIAQDRVVCKGEKGIQLPVVIHGTKETKAGGVEEITLLRRSYVFCRCQTTELEKRGTR